MIIDEEVGVLLNLKSLIMNGYIDKKLKRHVWIVCGGYACAGIMWILISDPLLAYLAGPEQLTRLQSWKGVIFVIVTSLFLLVLVRRKNISIKGLFVKLRNQMHYFQDTFEQAAVGIVHISKDEQWIRVNQAICEMLEYDYSEFKTLSLEQIVHSDDLVKGREMDRQVTEGTLDSYVMEKRYLTRKGKLINTRLTKSAVRDSDGNLQYLIAIIEDITTQKKAENQLKRSLKEKEMLLAEVHHRVKNNLAIISGLMELQAFSSSDERVQMVLRESMMRVKSMALIHESYYEGGRLSHVTVNSYLQDFIAYVQQTYDGNLRIDLDAQPLRLNINQAMPCGLLLTELLLNCLNSNGHDQEEKTVQVTLNQNEGGEVTLSLKGGIMSLGITSEEPSLASTIIEALVTQLEASMEIDRKENRTNVLITFTLKQDKKGSSSAFLDSETQDS